MQEIDLHIILPVSSHLGQKVRPHITVCGHHEEVCVRVVGVEGT